MADAPNGTRNEQGSFGFATVLALLLVALMPTQKTLKGPVTAADLVVFLGAVGLVVVAAVGRLTKRPGLAGVTVPPAVFFIIVVVALLGCLRAGGQFLAAREELEGEEPAIEEALTEEATDEGEDTGEAAKKHDPLAPVKTLVKEMVQMVGLFLLAPLVLLSGLRQRRDVLVACGIWATMTCLVAAHGLLQAAGGDPMAVRSTFESRLVYGAYMAMSLPLLWAFAMSGHGLVSNADGIQTWRDVAVRVFSAAAVLAGVFSIPAFGPFWAAMAGLLVVSLLMPAAPQRRIGIAGAWAVVVAAALLVGPKAREYSPASVPLQVDTGEGELQIREEYAEWQAAYTLMMGTDGMNSFGHNLVVGTGPGQYQDQIALFGLFIPVGKIERDAQNQFLVMGATLGLSGVLALALLVGRSVAGAGRALRSGHADPQVRTVAAAVIGSLVAFVVAGLYTTPIVRGTGLVLMLVLCVGLVVERLASNAE